MTLDTRVQQLLQQTIEFFKAQGQQPYLVGGSLRNILLGEPCADWDIVIQGDAPGLARQLADFLGGHYAHFHEKADRVVVPLSSEQKENLIIDVAAIKGKTVEDDLRQRDFTIDAMAAPLASVIQFLQAGGQIAGIIDPSHGMEDIEAWRLRAVIDGVFRYDPLRMLRTVRLMARYDLTIDPHTEAMIRRDAALLPQVAPERIHDEFYTLLSLKGAMEHLRFLDALGLFMVLMPEFIPARGMPQPFPHRWDVLQHSIETVGMLEQLAALMEQPAETIRQSPWERGEEDYLVTIQQLLKEAEQQRIFQRAMLSLPRTKLAGLMHDIGKPATFSKDEHGNIHFYGHPQAGVPLALQVMKRIKASTQDCRFVQQVVGNHMRPGQLAQVESITPRVIRRYFVDLGPTGIAVALISLADRLATGGPDSLSDSWERHLATVCLLLTQYIRHRESILPPRIVDASELMHRFHLEPGPLVGRLLEEIAEAQAEGTVHSKQEAFWLAEEKLKNLAF